jgi:hypothetical protein
MFTRLLHSPLIIPVAVAVWVALAVIYIFMQERRAFMTIPNLNETIESLRLRLSAVTDKAKNL